ncbi:TPA: hypothetical protein MIG92_04395 [Klebsiella pneumoniae]|nr:hypothetical protein B5L94_14780 [Klebsiella pneumoniae]OVW34680.1 hypothetical protein BME52_12105 [Klebsiella pneumoniae]PLH37447.1 hypothetical protein B6J28_01455 [Klebsiella pneumoniae]HBX7952407.1 hypothetical protein [Klebsiella pneumoniae]
MRPGQYHPRVDGTRSLEQGLSALPDGIYAQVALYSDHFTHVSVMRKVLLRMTSWMHYLYLDH